MRVNVAPRRQNSRRADVNRKFPSHLAWLRKRPCLLAHKHECIGKMEAHHVNEGSGRGMGQKCPDYLAVPLCSESHRVLHATGIQTWEAIHGISLLDAAKEYAKLSPHKHLWENSK